MLGLYEQLLEFEPAVRYVDKHQLGDLLWESHLELVDTTDLHYSASDMVEDEQAWYDMAARVQASAEAPKWIGRWGSLIAVLVAASLLLSMVIYYAVLPLLQAGRQAGRKGFAGNLCWVSSASSRHGAPSAFSTGLRNWWH